MISPDPVCPICTVVVHPDQTFVKLSAKQKAEAIGAAYRVTMSPHEWEWNNTEQATMAQFVLWAHQRICAVEDCLSDHLQPYED